MRLGQLARKLSLRPQEIVDFLATRDIIIEDGSNTRLEDAYAEMVIGKFAPHTSREEVTDLPDEKEQEVAAAATVADPIEELSIATTPALVQQSEKAEPIPTGNPVEEINHEQEVIKAPKVELQGLKVLGKIELPDLKKKAEKPLEPTDTPEAGEPAEPRRRAASDDRKPHTYKKSRSDNRQDANPIAQARDREAQEARRKRDEAAEFAKEQRTKNYYKKVKVSSPTKQARLVEDQLEEIATASAPATPKGFWGRLMQWFKS